MGISQIIMIVGLVLSICILLYWILGCIFKPKFERGLWFYCGNVYVERDGDGSDYKLTISYSERVKSNSIAAYLLPWPFFPHRYRDGEYVIKACRGRFIEIASGNEVFTFHVRIIGGSVATIFDLTERLTNGGPNEGLAVANFRITTRGNSFRAVEDAKTMYLTLENGQTKENYTEAKFICIAKEKAK